MFSLIRSESPKATIPLDLSDLLIDIARYGHPRLCQLGSKGEWHCSVEVNVSPVGAKFEVRSEFDHKTPLDAALVCRDRLHAAIKSIGGQA